MRTWSLPTSPTPFFFVSLPTIFRDHCERQNSSSSYGNFFISVFLFSFTYFRKYSFLNICSLHFSSKWQFISSSSSSSSSGKHVVGPLIDPFRSHTSGSLCICLPWFLPFGFFFGDWPVARIPPGWGKSPEKGKSSGRIATVSLSIGMFWDGISSIPDETVIPLWLGRHCTVCGNRVHQEKARKKETKILNNELSTLPFICPLNTKHISAVPVAVLYGYDGMLFCEEW
jgi:hypothetical protein